MPYFLILRKSAQMLNQRQTDRNDIETIYKDLGKVCKTGNSKCSRNQAIDGLGQHQ